MNSRKIVGLIVSYLGGVLYLFLGLMTTYQIYFSIPSLVTAAFVIIGTVIGVKRIKIGGIIILPSIPLFIILPSIPLSIPLNPLYLIPGIIVISGGVINILSNDGNEVKVPKETQN